MKSKFIKQLSIALSVSMIISATPVSANVISAQKKSKNNATQSAEDTSAKGKKYEEGQAIVMYKGSSEKETTAFAKSLGSDMEVTDAYHFGVEKTGEASGLLKRNKDENVTVALVKSKSNESTEQLIDKLEKRKGIMYAEPNYIVTKRDYNDTYYKYQWALENVGQNNGTPGYDVNADSEELSDKDDNERVIAIVDTGVDYNHEDLKDVIWNNPYNNSLQGEHGYDFHNYDADPMDDNGHGTHCSGIMAGKSNNGVGIAGIAKSNNIKIMALKFLDSEGNGDIINAIGAYNYIYKAQKLGVNVVAINNSWGASGYDDNSDIFKYVIDSVGEMGAISVCAAGNDAADNDQGFDLPSTIDSDYVLSVAASNENDELAGFSNYGAEKVDIAAPGADILSSVSYPCFNPGIYSNKDEFCSLFENYDNKELVQVISDNSYTGNVAEADQIAYGTYNEGQAETSVSITDNEYFESGDGNKSSLKWTISGSGSNEFYNLYLPYKAQEGKNLYSSVMIKVVGPSGEYNITDLFSMPSICLVSDGIINENGYYDIDTETLYNGSMITESNNFWSRLSGNATSDVKNENRAICIYIQTAVEGDYTVYIDNMGVSKTDLNENDFGKYDYYNGTSMAAPYVTGAVAVVANAYPQEDALEIKHRIIGSIRRSSALEGKVKSSGVLDLSKVQSPLMSITRASLNAGEICIEGKYLENATLEVNGEDVTPSSQNSESLSFSGENYLNKLLTITLKKGDDILTKECYILSGESFDSYSAISGSLDSGYFVSGGDKVYYINAYGEVSIGIPSLDEEGNHTLLLDLMGSAYNPYLFDGSLVPINYELYNSTDIVCINDKLYTVLDLYEGFSEQKIVVEFSEDCGWQKLCDLPDEFMNQSGFTLGAYEGSLYLMGGTDSRGACSTAVMKYDFEEGWIKDKEMPQGRYGSQAIQVGKLLVLTLGVNSDNTIPKNFIYDGTDWKVSNTNLEGILDKTQFCIGDNTYDVANAQLGLVDNGILYSGMRVNNLGDMFIYNLENDSYESTGHIIDVASLQSNVFATTISDRLYVISGTNDYMDYDNYGTDYDMENTIDILSMPVNNGYVKVIDNSSKGGSITGTGEYLPGDTISIEANV